jgi:DNA polymerase-3 subunit epsilon
MSHTFTAIDFETAQGYRYTICQVGIVRVVNGVIVKTFESLVKPPCNYYWDRFIDIHGITPDMTRYSPTFDSVWHQIEPFIKGQNVVAHNMVFDAGCLKGTLEYYQIGVPEFKQHCTCNLFGRRSLNDLCDEYNIDLNHHDALSDAKACAELFKIHLNKQ